MSNTISPPTKWLSNDPNSSTPTTKSSLTRLQSHQVFHHHASQTAVQLPITHPGGTTATFDFYSSVMLLRLQAFQGGHHSIIVCSKDEAGNLKAEFPGGSPTGPALRTPTTPFETTHRDFHSQNLGPEVLGEYRFCAVCDGRLKWSRDDEESGSSASMKESDNRSRTAADFVVKKWKAGKQ